MNKLLVLTNSISRNGSGYFPYFDGAFGFANIDSKGELPFFALDGTINIKHIDPNRLEGSIEMKFRNENSQLLKVQGEFSTIKNYTKI